MSIINLNEKVSLEELRTALLDASNSDAPSIICIDGKILLLSSADVAREHLAEKMAVHLSQHPEILSDLQTRIEKEEPMEW